MGSLLLSIEVLGTKRKTIPTCLAASNLMIAPPVLPQSVFCALKKTDWPKLDRIKFFILDILNARRASAELQLESQSEPMGSSEFNASFSIGFWNGLKRSPSQLRFRLALEPGPGPHPARSRSASGPHPQGPRRDACGGADRDAMGRHLESCTVTPGLWRRYVPVRTAMYSRVRS